MRKPGLAAILTLVVPLAGIVTFGQQTPLERRPPDTPVAASPLELKPDAHGNLSQEQMEQLFHVAADKDIENDKRLRDYTYIERDEERRLDGKGDVKSNDVKTYEVMELYGEQVQRLIEKDDKALDTEDSAKEERRFRRSSTSARTNRKTRARSASRKKRKIAKRAANSCVRSPMPTTFAWLELSLWKGKTPG